MLDRAPCPVQLKGMKYARRSLLIGLATVFLLSCSPEHEIVPLDPLSAGRTDRPNDFLVCPAGFCDGADATAAAYPVTQHRLFEAWLGVVRQAPRTRLVAADSDEYLIHAEQRSLIFRFVDTVLVRIVETSEGSSFVAYSRSEMGYSDLGVNRDRLDRWIAALDEDVMAAPGGDTANDP